uniref:Uncharacterized protein n=1 Tax=Lepeophtheirus salmonis TaxID=72036 RepID=A0A0K2TUA3_LEPSM
MTFDLAFLLPTIVS